MILNYKCPNCGSDMIFDTKSGYLTCNSCGREDAISQTTRETVNRTEHDINEFNCKNCGATLITENDTTSTSCSFCDSPMVIASRLSDSFLPVKVIPFKISKEEASSTFKKWRQKSPLYPNEFKNSDRVKEIIGIYIPFWLYDCKLNGKLSATGTKVKRYEKGDKIYTETSYYNIHRDYDIEYSNIPVDASEKMNDKLMDKLEPFNYDDLKPFNMPYLSGFVSEKYNYTDKELMPRVRTRIDYYVNYFLNSTIHGYTSVTNTNVDINTKSINADYTLLPIWLVCYDYKTSVHNFYMNGQTGKVVGTPPISKAKAFTWFGGLSIGLFALMRLLTALFGGYL